MTEKKKKCNYPPAPKGNKRGIKLKLPEIRQQAYEQYCEHLAKGKSKKSWVFEHPEFFCTWETIEKYIKDTSEFDPQKRKAAEVKGYAKWEQVVEDSADGKNKDANTASLQMLMRNKYGWDKKEAEQDHSTNVEIIAAAESFMKQFKEAQKHSQSSALKIDDNNKSIDNQS